MAANSFQVDKSLDSAAEGSSGLRLPRSCASQAVGGYQEQEAGLGKGGEDSDEEELQERWAEACEDSLVNKIAILFCFLDTGLVLMCRRRWNLRVVLQVVGYTGCPGNWCLWFEWN